MGPHTQNWATSHTYNFGHLAHFTSTLYSHTGPSTLDLAHWSNSHSWPTRTVDQRWPRTVSSHSQLAHWLWPTLTNSHTENLTFYTSKENSHSLPQTTFWIQLPIAHFFWSRTVWKVIFLTNLPPTLVQTPKHLKNSTKTDQNIKFSSVLHIFKLFFVFFILFFKKFNNPTKNLQPELAHCYSISNQHKEQKLWYHLKGPEPVQDRNETDNLPRVRNPLDRSGKQNARTRWRTNKTPNMNGIIKMQTYFYS
jgi:hypothetical protein